MKPIFYVSPTWKGHEDKNAKLRWVVYLFGSTDIVSIRSFRSKRKAFKWAEREAARVGGVEREFHRMTSWQRKAYWRKVAVLEVAE